MLIWATFLGLTLTLGTLLGETFTFSENGRRSRYELVNDEIWVRTRTGTLPPSGARRVLDDAWLVSMPPTNKDFRVKGAEISASPLYALAAPVFYQVGEKRRISSMRILTAKVLVKGKTDERATRSASLLEGWTLLTYANTWEALAALERLRGSVEHMPVFARHHTKRQFTGPLQRTVNDPLYASQWHLTHPTANLNLRSTWDRITGMGINMVIVDDGVDISHEDLRDNAYPISSNYHRNVKEGPDNDPTPPAKDNHGTGAAGLAVGRGFNGVGIAGVAPEARFIAIRMIGAEVDDETEGLAFSYQPGSIVTHVSSNSWGPNDDAKTVGNPGPLMLAGLEAATTKNRDGLGTVVVISAGNGRGEGDDSGYDGYSSSRFAISVGAVNKNMEQSSYSESGMAIAVSAFGGETSPPGMLWTTNNTGGEAHTLLREMFSTTTAPQNYSDAYNGTSGAAPQVSGAVALLLQSNPRLGYRDVKEILMRSAARTGLNGGDPFVTNRGGFSFSHSFGAGLVDVSAALTLAQSWTNLGPLERIEGDAADLPVEIPDANQRGVTVEFSVPVSAALRVEHVEVVIDVEHPNRGDLGFVVVSPSGMVSVAEPREPDDSANFTNVTFTSVRNWGEPSDGTWRVRVIDSIAGDTGYVNSMKLRIYGTRR